MEVVPFDMVCVEPFDPHLSSLCSKSQHILAIAALLHSCKLVNFSPRPATDIHTLSQANRACLVEALPHTLQKLWLQFGHAFYFKIFCSFMIRSENSPKNWSGLVFGTLKFFEDNFSKTVKFHEQTMLSIFFFFFSKSTPKILGQTGAQFATFLQYLVMQLHVLIKISLIPWWSGNCVVKYGSMNYVSQARAYFVDQRHLFELNI